MMARQRSWIPPRKRITTRSDVKPFGASEGSTNRSTICANAATTERPTVTNASQAIRSSGAYENERTARRAQLDVPDERVGRRAVRPLGPDVRDAGLPEADPGAQAADEPVGLGQRVQRVDHAAVEQREVAGVEGDRRRRPSPGTGDRTALYAIRIGERRDAPHAYPVDDVPALEPLLVERRRSARADPAGRRRAGSRRRRSRSRMPLVKALWEPKFRVWLTTTTRGSRRGELGEHLARVVRAGVVDEDDLVVDAERRGTSPSAARTSPGSPARPGSRR